MTDFSPVAELPRSHTDIFGRMQSKNDSQIMKEYSDVWSCYKRNGDKATCTLCPKILGCKASLTTGLHRHLQKIHKMERASQETLALTVPASTSKQQKLEETSNLISSSRKITLEKIVSKLAAKDGIPIFTICKSEFIRNSLNLQNFKLPKQPSDVMKLIHKHYEITKKQILSKNAVMKSEKKNLVCP
ncbi:uncharacterized protein LOC143915180 [Arctopsyche grandis]|uniref:uncharacterized protein LOC143915180 n=1 Tax=Arctopsyche grandis TaxID=121162 RepID=UPI00406D86B2